MKESFRKAANHISNMAGSAWAFMLALTTIIVWAVIGSIFDYSDTWQLVINTGTTIVTFLMVFLIQNTQNRDGKAMQLKLDELLRATKARDNFIDIEDISDDELAGLAEEFSRIQKSDGDREAIVKLHGKIQSTLTKQHAMPGEQLATQVVDMLNPFAATNKPRTDDKKPKK